MRSSAPHTSAHLAHSRVRLVSEAYNLSKPKAQQALRILRPEQVEELRDWMSQGGQ